MSKPTAEDMLGSSTRREQRRLNTALVRMRPTASGVLGFLALLSAFALGFWQGRAFLAVDGCLDKGGSFDYLAGICDFTFNHPAHVALNLGALGLSFVLFGFGVFLLLRRRAHAG